MENTATTAAAAAAPTLDELMLLRLALASPPGDGLPRSLVARDLAPLWADAAGSAPAWRERLSAAVDRRTAAGEVVTPRRGRLGLTDAGRRVVAVRFGERAGAGATWVEVRDGLLVTRALGRGDDPGGKQAPTRSADALRAAILLRQHAPDVFGRVGTVPTKLREVADLLAARAVRARRGTPAELRAALLRGWLATAAGSGGTGEGEPKVTLTPTAGADPLADLAVLVLAAARRSPEEARLGEKVFIADLWDWLCQDGRPLPGVPPGDLDAFKQRLGEANARGLVRLSRADLAGVRSPETIAASEVRWMGATFHLLRLT